MIERSRGFQIRRFCVKPGRSVVEAAEDEPDAGDTALCETALQGPGIEASV